jgi:cell division protein FtsQ
MELLWNMSDVAVSDLDEFFEAFEKSSAEKKSPEKKKDRKISALKIVVAVLAVFLLIEWISFSFVLPCFSRPSVVFSGLNLVSEEEISRSLSPLLKSSWVKFNAEKAVSLLGGVSAVESVSVKKQFPNKVFVSVKERVPVAKTILSVNGFSKSVQIDKNCVLFDLQSASAVQDNSVPLVSGIPIENLQEGMRLPAKFHTLLEQISTIRNLSQRYFEAVSEIQVVPKQYGNYELVVYPTNARIRVLTDRSLTEDALKSMLVVLDVVKSIEPDVAEVDLRYDSLSYRCR